MENSIADYEAKRVAAKAFYATIKEIWSPALNDAVIFNSNREADWKRQEGIHK